MLEYKQLIGSLLIWQAPSQSFLKNNIFGILIGVKETTFQNYFIIKWSYDFTQITQTCWHPVSDYDNKYICVIS